MSSLNYLLRLPAFLAIALFAFGQISIAEEAVPAPASSDVDETSDDNFEEKDVSRPNKRHAAQPATASTLTLAPATNSAPGSGALRLDSNSRFTFAPVETAESEAVIVRGFHIDVPDYPALPEVEGTRINSGKKTSFTKPSDFPTISNNNYRQVLATTPGLLFSEEPTSPVVNIGYRGLNSQRAEFSQVLKDGVSIKNEQFGFPEGHYVPVLDAVERIEVIRAGAALQFGPQPGGAINFVMKMPSRDGAFHFQTFNAVGSDDFYSNFTSIDGTIGQIGYYAYYDHRQRDGFREANGDYDLNNGSIRLVYDLTPNDRFILTGDFYDEEHGEPGGLRTFTSPGGIDPVTGIDYNVLYQDDRDATSRFFDRFRFQRYYGTLEYQHLFSEATELDVKAFGGYVSRYSHRQRTSGNPVGVLPFGPAAGTDSIQEREVWNEGAEIRLRHDYALGGDTSTFAGGLYFYHALQDRDDERGVTPDAETGVQRNFTTGETWDLAIFAENRFHFGRLSIVPGMRLEFLNQSLDESFNITRPNNLLSRDDDFFVPLFSLGLGYVLVEGQQPMTTTEKDAKDAKNMVTKTTMVPGGLPRLELYGTVAQAYRPLTYGELVPTSANGVVNGDLEEGKSLQFELGMRGKPFPYLTFDVSGFYYTFDDQVDVIQLAGGSSTGNVGDAEYWGFEAAMELDILGMINGGTESPYGQLNFYANVTLLDAEFTSGPFNSNAPSYAPEYQFKTGAIYRWKDRVKVAFLGTFVDDSFADAGNTAEFFIPAYNVWDLTAEVNFWNGRVGVFAGINNLFDQDYWGEVRDEGIVPAYRRNYYGGVKIRF